MSFWKNIFKNQHNDTQHNIQHNHTELKGLFVTLGINDSQKKWHLAKEHSSIMLSIMMLNVIMLSVIMLSVIMMNVIILSVFMLSESCGAD